MDGKLIEEDLEQEKKIILIKKNKLWKKILIIIAKILILFIMPILVAILDYFVF